jgi:hypothetical protein
MPHIPASPVQCSVDAVVAWVKLCRLAQRLYGLVVVAQLLMRKAPAAAETGNRMCNDRQQGYNCVAYASLAPAAGLYSCNTLHVNRSTLASNAKVTSSEGRLVPAVCTPEWLLLLLSPTCI